VVLPWAAQQLISEVDQLFVRARNQSDLEVQSDYAKYLVVRVNGLVERTIEEIVVTYTEAQASSKVTAHVVWRMKLFQNPSVERIVQLAGSFNKDWGKALKEQISVEEREALGSLATHRNSVAHGGTSTISLAQVGEFYEHVKTLLVKVATVF
jgi:hypothetical protein